MTRTPILTDRQKKFAELLVYNDGKMVKKGIPAALRPTNHPLVRLDENISKAGLLEIADLFVVNKADRPGAKDAKRDLELMIDLSQVTGQAVRRPEIIMTTKL